MKKREKPTLAFQTLQKLLEAAFTVCAMHPSLSATKLDQLIADARLRAHVRVARRWRSSGKGLDYNTLGYVIHRWRRSPRTEALDPTRANKENLRGALLAV
jgi:hypothetical protein